ncbi:hypothetical protein B0H66DRAFT_603035 [Apodospora peruviana]|uniref:Uncharacterized protein n=1 Tax=Apodospora peruviana TaxID=516989 RepID=A0AAE0I530_9PEZI|nr:hypothetical protein B0H66DRAFT_603035 [Apodospora peruviana]
MGGFNFHGGKTNPRSRHTSGGWMNTYGSTDAPALSDQWCRQQRDCAPAHLTISGVNTKYTGTRRPTLTAFAFALASVGFGFKYISVTLRRNELAQKSDASGPNLYVTVDRSGGGI